MQKLRTIPILWLLLLSGSLLLAASPSWWSDVSTQVLDEEADENNYAPANLGQLKHVAKMAKGHLDSNLLGGSGTAVNTLIAGFVTGTTPEEIAANYAPLNIGQLKYVAKPFYDQLLSVGYDTKANLIAHGLASWTHEYPWDPAEQEDQIEENYAPANLGQLKLVFSFDLSEFDTDADGLPDIWETIYVGSLDSAATDDLDNDGLTNFEEFKRKTFPTEKDSDLDGMPDGWEVVQGLDPLSGLDGIANYDGDFLTNAEEFFFGKNWQVLDQHGSIVIGGGFGLFLRSDGTVWSFGATDKGQAGVDGDANILRSPIKVPNLDDVVKVAAGEDHGLALKRDGTVWTWGNNDHGQLGDGTKQDRHLPAPIVSIGDVIDIATAGDSSYAVLYDGTVRSWGDNSSGQLGDSSQIERTTPVTVKAPGGVGLLEEVRFIAASRRTVMVIKKSGEIMGWGDNSFRQIGDGTALARYSPVLVSGPEEAVAIASGDTYSVAVGSDGTLWTWGSGTKGELGNGSMSDQVEIPTQIAGISDIKAITAGRNHTLALKSDGTVYGFGSNEFGQLGDGTTTDKCDPVNIVDLTGIIKISAGPYHSVAINANGSVFSWGMAARGELGNGARALVGPAVENTGISGVLKITCYNHSVYAIKDDGTLWAWGQNQNGQLADGTAFSSAAPVQVDLPDTVHDATGGNGYAAATLDDGSVWCWGENSSGQLGTNDALHKDEPTRVSGTNGNGWLSAVFVAAGRQHTLALDVAGKVYGWGENSIGQVGDGTYSNRLSPVEVIAGVVAIAAGETHSIALLEDGSVCSWGDNTSYQLASGSNSSRNIPLPVMISSTVGINGVIKIAAGGSHSLALRSDGSVWSWGDNSWGQLGNSGTNSVAYAVQVSGLTNVVAIDVGEDSSMAVKADGTIWKWGKNFQSANESATEDNVISEPRVISELEGNVGIAVGRNFAVARKADGTIAVWGFAGYGEFGTGYFGRQVLPRRVEAMSIDGLSPGLTLFAAPNDHTDLNTSIWMEARVEGTPSKVEFFNDGIKIAEATSPPWSTEWTPPTWGNFLLSAQATFSEETKSQISDETAVRVHSRVDIDLDGMIDGWEIIHFGNLENDGTQDGDEDEIVDLDEFISNTDPNNYFNDGEWYPLVILGGGDQRGIPGETLPEKLKVKGGYGTYPVEFRVVAGSARLSAIPNPSAPEKMEAVTVYSDEGVAEVYVTLGSIVDELSMIEMHQLNVPGNDILRTTARVADPLLEPPANLVAIPASESSADLSWESSDMTKETTIEISLDSGKTWSVAAVVAAGVEEHTLTGIPSGKVMIRLITGSD